MGRGLRGPGINLHRSGMCGRAPAPDIERDVQSGSNDDDDDDDGGGLQ